MINRTGIETDINLEQARRAFDGVSFRSDQRGDRVLAEYAAALNGLEIVRNHAEDLLQLIFSGKPEENVRSLLKSHGFKWSPRFNAWQRQLTTNAEYALKNYVMTKEVMAQYAA